MAQYEETKYHSYGLQLRSIREKLRLTLENIRQHIGISRSYVSEFEKNKVPGKLFRCKKRFSLVLKAGTFGFGTG